MRATNPRRPLAAFLILVLVATLAATSASAHHYEKDPGYPHSGNLKKREAWQVDALQHARAHLREAKSGPLLLADGSRLSGDVRSASRWVRVVERELGETREAIAAAAYVPPVVTTTSTGSYSGCGDDGGYNYHLQFADFWLCKYPWLDNTIESQIRAAEIIGSQSAGDPWPNCPDPYDGSGATWSDTADCESGGW